MKPLGRKHVKFSSKTDCHPGKGYINWWEDIANPSKTRDRRNAKREIEKELNEKTDL